MLNPGSIVGDARDARNRYQIVRAIGRGGMGEVYEAVHMQLARRVALKTIRAELAQKPELLGRFRREAESAAALGHPNLVQVTDFYDAPGESPFLVMEMLDGCTLKELLESESRLDPARACFIGVQLLSGLAAAHRANIIHRDVKPANVFLQSTTAMRDLVKVLDFGVAKLALEATPGARAMTQAGEVIGTLSYMAPEQAQSGAPIDARTDIYGVGATLFHALAGVRPFDVTEPGLGRTPLDRVAPWVNRDLAAIIERALERSPDARWSTADDMAAALQAFASAGAGAPPPAPSRPSAPQRQSAPPRPSAPSAPPQPSAPPGWNPAAIGGAPFNAWYDPSQASLGSASTVGAGMTGLGASSGGGTSGGSSTNGGTTSGTNGLHAVSGSAPVGAVPYAMPQGARMAPPAQMPAPPMMGPTGMAPMGMIPMGMAPAYGQNPYAYGAPPAQLASPYGAMPPKSRPWWLLIVGVALVAVLVPYLISFLAIRRASDPSNIATTVERQVLLQPKQPCPAGDACTQSVEEHGLTYPICTRKIPKFSPYKPGEMVVAGDDKRIALISTDLGSGKYEVRFLTAQKSAEIADEDIAGRLCRPGPRGGSQTLP